MGVYTINDKVFSLYFNLHTHFREAVLLEGADCRIDTGFVYVSEIIALNSYAANYGFCANSYSIHTTAFLFCSSLSERNV